MSAKTITITDPATSNQYVLELNLDEIIKLEERGITQSTVADRPIGAIYNIFVASFNMHAQRVPLNKRKEFFDLMIGDKLVDKITDMYIDAMSAVADENDSGNEMWEANW